MATLTSRQVYEHEPAILVYEVRGALKKLKTNRSAGRDTIFAEELKNLGDTGVKIIVKLCNQLWRTGKWSNNWK